MITDVRGFADESIPENEAIAAARADAVESGLPVVSASVGAALRLFALLVDARNVVEVGTGSGMAALWLLSGMREDGVVTSIDPEAEHHRVARAAFDRAGITHRRARLIPGRPTEVLPRLTASGYELVLLNRDPRAMADYVSESVRLLKPGGLLITHDALWHDRVPDPAQRDADTVAVRELVRDLLVDERFDSTLLPVGAGLLVSRLR